MKTVGITDYKNQTPPWKKFPTPVKNKKIFIIMGGAHLQCVHNHYAKFEHKKNENCW